MNRYSKCKCESEHFYLAKIYNTYEDLLIGLYCLQCNKLVTWVKRDKVREMLGKGSKLECCRCRHRIFIIIEYDLYCANCWENIIKLSGNYVKKMMEK